MVAGEDDGPAHLISSPPPLDLAGEGAPSRLLPPRLLVGSSSSAGLLPRSRLIVYIEHVEIYEFID